MFSIKTTILNINNFKIIYTNKSVKVLDCLNRNNKYNKFKNIDKSLQINNELSYAEHFNKNINYLALNEIICKLKILEEYKYSLTLNFDNIIINELNDNVLIFCFDNKLNIKNIIDNIINIAKVIDVDNYLIINFTDLFHLNSIQLLILISYLFKKIKIIYCKILKQNVLIGYNYIYNKQIIVLLNNIVKKWKNGFTIKTFGIDINDIQSKVNIFNQSIFNNLININIKMCNSNIDIDKEKELLFNNYLKKYKLIPFNFNCNHDLNYLSIYNCFICNNCFELFNLF